MVKAWNLLGFLRLELFRHLDELSQILLDKPLVLGKAGAESLGEQHPAPVGIKVYAVQVKLLFLTSRESLHRHLEFGLGLLHALDLVAPLPVLDGKTRGLFLKARTVPASSLPRNGWASPRWLPSRPIR